MRRIAAGTLTQIVGTFLSGDGHPESATGTVTVAVVDGAGTAVTSGNADDLNSGRYGFDVDLTTLDTYAVTFTGAFSGDAVRTTVETVEVVGAVPLSVEQVRGSDEDLADIVKYPSDQVLAELQAAWDVMEQGLSVAMVPRSARVTVDGTGRDTLTVPNMRVRSVVAAAIDGSSIDVGDVVAKDSGAIYNPSGWPSGHGNVTVHYTHGWDTPPDPVVRALRLLTIDRLVTRATPSRATSLSTDVGAFRLTIAGRDGWTGLPDVDAIINQFGYSVGFA